MGLGGYAERKAVVDWQLFAVAIGGEMSGVGEVDESVRRDGGTEAGGEATLLAQQEKIVEGAQYDGGFGDGGRVERTDERRDQHGRTQALAANIADHDTGAAADLRGVKEIAAHLLRGTVDSIDAEARIRALLRTQQKALHAVCGLHL